MMREIQRYASEDRPNIRTIHDDVSTAFTARNEERGLEGKHPFPVPSYETVGRAIHMLDPFEVAVDRDGFEAARKKFMPVGEGLRVTRPLERVEIDENTIDIISLTEFWGLLRRDGEPSGINRIYRLYREEGLSVRKRKARRRAVGTRAPILLEAKANTPWSLDFVNDQFACGRRFRILNVVDVVTLECLAASHI